MKRPPWGAGEEENRGARPTRGEVRCVSQVCDRVGVVGPTLHIEADGPEPTRPVEERRGAQAVLLAEDLHAQFTRRCASISSRHHCRDSRYLLMAEQHDDQVNGRGGVLWATLTIFSRGLVIAFLGRGEALPLAAPAVLSQRIRRVFAIMCQRLNEAGHGSARAPKRWPQRKRGTSEAHHSSSSFSRCCASRLPSPRTAASLAFCAGRGSLLPLSQL